MVKLTTAALAAALGSFAMAGDTPPGFVLRAPGEMEFKASGGVPPGAEYHLIHEDKGTGAIQSIVRFPSGYFLPPHAHSHDEVLYVVKGGVTVGIGGQLIYVGKGGYAVIPAGKSHSLKTKGWTKTEMLVLVSGPFDLIKPK